MIVLNTFEKKIVTFSILLLFVNANDSNKSWKSIINVYYVLFQTKNVQ